MNEAGGFEAFAMYHALKLHFSGKYDYVKYNGKTNVSKDQFMLRKDKFTYYKLSRRYKKEELFGFYVANFLIDTNKWVGELLQEDANSNYKAWIKIQQSISYIFEQDLNHMFDLVEMPEEMLKVVAGQYPLLYNEHLKGKIKLETIVILNDILNFLPMWRKKISDDIVFPNFATKCEKYIAFLNYDKPKLKNLLKGKICQAA